MGAEIDKKLEGYFKSHIQFIHCKAGCSECCEKGDYPVSEIELKNLMLGYSLLESSKKIQVQENIKNMQRGGACPFLIDKLCSVYSYRPMVCKIHGLAYLTRKGIVKVPYCVNSGKNYSEVYSEGEFFAEPIKENLDELIPEGEVRNLYDWFNQ